MYYKCKATYLVFKISFKFSNAIKLIWPFNRKKQELGMSRNLSFGNIVIACYITNQRPLKIAKQQFCSVMVSSSLLKLSALEKNWKFSVKISSIMQFTKPPLKMHQNASFNVMVLNYANDVACFTVIFSLFSRYPILKLKKKIKIFCKISPGC